MVLERYSAILNSKDAIMLHIEGPSQEKMAEPTSAHGSIILDKFSAFWDKGADPVLEDLSFEFERGKFYGITGKIGSGKSSLLQSLIQQIPFVKGRIWLPGSFSYAEQESVIFSESIRANVVFGAEFEEEKYRTVL